MKVSEIRAREIASYLADGLVGKEIVRIFSAKFGIGKGSVEGLITKAKPLVAEIVAKRNEAMEKAVTAKLEQIAIERMATKEHKRGLLKDIMDGKRIVSRNILIDHEEIIMADDGKNILKKVRTKKVVKVPIEPDAYAVINAIHEDNAMTGDNAPIKTENAHLLIPIVGTIIK